MMLGPDAARYWLMGEGKRVARPFHLRWLLPSVCGQNVRCWWVVWACSWPLLFGGVFWLAGPLGWRRALFAAVVTLALPGVLGPQVTHPVGVDLPAMALAAMGAAAASHQIYWLAIPFVWAAASIKESAPVWAALWAWNPVLLAALVYPLTVAWRRRPALDEVTALPNLRRVHDHPFRTAIEARRGRWRDAWLMVAPWGVCLLALVHPTWQVLAVLAVAHLQLLIATDTTRLLHTAAGPVVAMAAAAVLPVSWLPVAAVLHVFWWRKPEVI